MSCASSFHKWFLPAPEKDILAIPNRFRFPTPEQQRSLESGPQLISSLNLPTL